MVKTKTAGDTANRLIWVRHPQGRLTNVSADESKELSTNGGNMSLVQRVSGSKGPGCDLWLKPVREEQMPDQRDKSEQWEGIMGFINSSRGMVTSSDGELPPFPPLQIAPCVCDDSSTRCFLQQTAQLNKKREKESVRSSELCKLYYIRVLTVAE
jgi:hypothetical protein